MKTKKTSESTQTTTPTARPELQYALDQNRSLFDLLSGRQAAPFSTVAGFDPATVMGLNLTEQRALNGSPLINAAQGAVGNIAANGFLPQGANSYISNIASGGNPNAAAQYLLPTAQGNFLDFRSNPYFQQGVSNINDSVGSIFERAGRTGSGANQSSVARGVGDFAAGVYNSERANQLGAANALAGIYNQDISNAFGASNVLNANAGTQLNAAGLAPTLANQDYIDLQNLLNVGTARQNQQQNEIADQLYRYNFPYENAIQATNILNAGTGSIGSLLGQTTTGKTTETTSGGLGGAILGGLLTGASMFATGGASAGMGGLGSLFGGAAGGGGGASAPSLAGLGGGYLPQFNYNGFNLGGVPMPGYGG